MFRNVTAVLFSLLLATVAASAGEKGKISGVLMDKMCSAETKTTAAALKHTKECALMDDCVKSGYGVLTADGNYLTFDEAGNKKVAEFLKQFKGKDNIKITVEGTQEGSELKVTSLKGA